MTLSGLMLLLLLAEWGLMEPSETSGDNASQISSNQKNIEKGLPKLEMATQVIDHYSDMVESPLFIEGRKPIVENDGEGELVAVGEIDDLVLIGIYSVKDELVGLFSQKKAEKKFSKIKVGEDISGWQLKEIKMDLVVLESKGRQKTVLLRKPRKVLKNKKQQRVKRKNKAKSNPNPFAAALEKSK